MKTSIITEALRGSPLPAVQLIPTTERELNHLLLMDDCIASSHAVGEELIRFVAENSGTSYKTLGRMYLFVDAKVLI